MTIIASGKIKGHEARGDAAIVETNGVPQVQVQNLWVAPGAPDVRLYVSPRTDGQIDDTAIELGLIADNETEVTRDLPADIDLASLGSVVVHCTQYSVLFGFATLTAEPQSDGQR